MPNFSLPWQVETMVSLE